jgi:hypothetical protein
MFVTALNIFGYLMRIVMVVCVKIIFVCIAIVLVCVWRMVAELSMVLRSLSEGRSGIAW